ncbi:hypothetical protein AgCh_017546 [Apium graveolens]
MAWNDLLHELLSLIFLNIIKDNQNISDLYQCLGVCRSWRELAKQCLLNIAPTPWLLLNQKYPDQTVTFNTTICNFHNTTRHVPESTLSFRLIDHAKTYACYDGWLLVGFDNKDFRTSTAFLHNPLSGVLLQLPPFPRHLKLHAHGPIKFVLSESCPTDRNCVICVKFSINGSSVLAFCKPAPIDDDYSIKGKRCLLSSFSSYWILPAEKDSYEIVDIVFCRGKFYTIDRFAALYVYNYDANTDLITSEPVIVEWFNVFNDQKVATGRVQTSRGNKNYNSLVKSKSGDLLMIKRIFDEKYSRVTVACSIFKLNMSNIDYYHWSEISNLTEKEALILGWNDCISVSVSEYNPTFKTNCIYFFDKYASGGKLVSRYGVYNLRTRTFLSYADDNGVDRDPENYKCCCLFAPSGLS